MAGLQLGPKALCCSLRNLLGPEEFRAVVVVVVCDGFKGRRLFVPSQVAERHDELLLVFCLRVCAANGNLYRSPGHPLTGAPVDVEDALLRKYLALDERKALRVVFPRGHAAQRE